jgi:Rps23 Pro-64 3,4-dihydroxylase Tpa1-like proline 4-hydroxylase
MTIKVVENFLEKEDLEYFQQDSLSVFKDVNTRFRSNLTHWPQNLIEKSNSIFTFEFKDGSERINRILTAMDKSEIHLKGDSIGIQYYFYSNRSYIPWHNDNHCRRAFTIYLNDWQLQWGGLFIYEQSPKDYRAIVPKPNMMVMNDDYTLHSVSYINDDSPPRATIQIFEL